MPKSEIILRVNNNTGLHARPAAMLVKLSNRYSSEIFIEKNGEKVNGKSIMGIMMLAAEPGSQLKITADGDDAGEALESIKILFESDFEE